MKWEKLRNHSLTTNKYVMLYFIWNTIVYALEICGFIPLGNRKSIWTDRIVPEALKWFNSIKLTKNKSRMLYVRVCAEYFARDHFWYLIYETPYINKSEAIQQYLTV